MRGYLGWVLILLRSRADAWVSPRLALSASSSLPHRKSSKLDAKAGSFFNPVPEPNNSDNGGGDEISRDEIRRDEILERTVLDEIHQMTRQKSKATQPSTIKGIPSNEAGLPLTTTSASIEKDPVSSRPFVGVGPSSLNDVTKPEYDDQGYTLYADERTGKKARVFEALVEYPCLFTLKIVGANQGEFVKDVLTIVATTCQIETHPLSIDHSVKHNGKWTSVTVKAPVQSAQMLYQLYEDIARDPRVKFKF